MVVWPKFELPNVLAPRNVRPFTRLNRFSSSTFNCATLVPPRRKFLMNTASVLYCGAVRALVIARGALPKGKAGAALTASLLPHVAVGWSAEASRSAKLPDVGI